MSQKISTRWSTEIQSKAPKLQKKKSPPIRIHMYSPFLWQISKGQSWLIIKKRWRRGSSNARQICSQGLKLSKHIHQKLTMSRLNGYDSVQCTTNARNIRSRRWRISNNSQINERIRSRSPKEGEGWGATPDDDSTLGLLELAFIWVALCLRNVTPIGAIICMGSNAGKSSKPKCNKIQWIKTRKKKACAKELLYEP